LTHEEFNDAVGAFVLDVQRAVSCFAAWTIRVELASPDSDRLRSVVNAEVDLRGPHDAPDKGLAELAAANYKLCVDSYGAHLAVEHSSFVLKAKLDRAPIIRWDYDREARNKPTSSHVQVTAHRGALSHLLSRLDHRTPHSIESLHIPMGGERFRPCLEDIAEFLIRDCGFPGTDGWAAALADGRVKWRRIQTRAVVRDSPVEAIAALTEMGYTVSSPAGGDEPSERVDKLTAW